MDEPPPPDHRPSTLFSPDGERVFVTLEVTRRQFEYCREWAAFLEADDSPLPERGPPLVEGLLEGYLSNALTAAMAEEPPNADFNARWPEEPRPPLKEVDDGIPF